MLLQRPPEVHKVARVVRLPVDGAVLHHVVHVAVEEGVLHQLESNFTKHIFIAIAP